MEEPSLAIRIFVDHSNRKFIVIIQTCKTILELKKEIIKVFRSIAKDNPHSSTSSFDIQSLHLYFVNYYELCDEYYVSDVLYDGATVTTTPPPSTTEADRYSQTSYINQWALRPIPFQYFPLNMGASSLYSPYVHTKLLPTSTLSSYDTMGTVALRQPEESAQNSGTINNYVISHITDSNSSSTQHIDTSQDLISSNTHQSTSEATDHQDNAIRPSVTINSGETLTDVPLSSILTSPRTISTNEEVYVNVTGTDDDPFLSSSDDINLPLSKRQKTEDDSTTKSANPSKPDDNEKSSKISSKPKEIKSSKIKDKSLKDIPSKKEKSKHKTKQPKKSKKTKTQTSKTQLKRKEKEESKESKTDQRVKQKKKIHFQYDSHTASLDTAGNETSAAQSIVGKADSSSHEISTAATPTVTPPTQTVLSSSDWLSSDEEEAQENNKRSKSISKSSLKVTATKSTSKIAKPSSTVSPKMTLSSDSSNDDDDIQQTFTTATPTMTPPTQTVLSSSDWVSSDEEAQENNKRSKSTSESSLKVTATKSTSKIAKPSSTVSPKMTLSSDSSSDDDDIQLNNNKPTTKPSNTLTHSTVSNNKKTVTQKKKPVAKPTSSKNLQTAALTPAFISDFSWVSSNDDEKTTGIKPKALAPSTSNNKSVPANEPVSQDKNVDNNDSESDKSDDFTFNTASHISPKTSTVHVPVHQSPNNYLSSPDSDFEGDTVLSSNETSTQCTLSTIDPQSKNISTNDLKQQVSKSLTVPVLSCPTASEIELTTTTTTEPNNPIIQDFVEVVAFAQDPIPPDNQEEGHAVEDLIGLKKQDGLDEDHSCSEDIPLLGDLPMETSDKDISDDLLPMETSDKDIPEKTTIENEKKLTRKMTAAEKSKRKRMKITKRKRGSINSHIKRAVLKVTPVNIKTLKHKNGKKTSKSRTTKKDVFSYPSSEEEPSILQTKHSKVNSSYQKAKKLTHNNKDSETAKEILNKDIERRDNNQTILSKPLNSTTPTAQSIESKNTIEITPSNSDTEGEDIDKTHQQNIIDKHTSPKNQAHSITNTFTPNQTTPTNKVIEAEEEEDGSLTDCSSTIDDSYEQINSRRHSLSLQGLATDASTMVPPTAKIHQRLTKSMIPTKVTPILPDKTRKKIQQKGSTPFSSTHVKKSLGHKSGHKKSLLVTALESISKEEEELALNLSQEGSNLSEILQNEKYW